MQRAITSAGRANVPFFAFNRGIISPKSLARVDLDRTALSAETMNNWLPKTQGAMSLRPGTQWFGSSLNDSGAEFLEFVASTDDVALLELTNGKMRVWLGDDAHAIALLSRPPVDTTVSLNDTGWSNQSTGGAVAVSTGIINLIPTMTGPTTSGVEITASSEWVTPGEPTVVSTNTSTSSSTNSHSISLPATYAAGDVLIIIFFTGGTGTHTTPAGWSLEASHAGGSFFGTTSVFSKTATGSEGASVTISTSGSSSGVHQSYAVTEVSGAVEVTVDNDPNSTPPNPPSLTPSWGSDSDLWLAVCVSDSLNITAAPSNYSDLLQNTGGGIRIGSARRSLEAASEDPGTFSAGALSLWSAFTIAIRTGGAGTAVNGEGWRIADGDLDTYWQDTGEGHASSLPSWLNVDFGSGTTVTNYTLRSSSVAGHLANMAKTWELIGSNFDTGTYATDTGKWILEDSRSAETGWAVSEKRSYTISDTGTPGPWRHWRLYVTATDGDTELKIGEYELLANSSTVNQARFSAGRLTLNATAIGSLARARRRVVVSDTGTEHALDIVIESGPVTLRVGSTAGDDDYINETSLGTGHHNLAFTPTTAFFHIDVQSDAIINRTVTSLNVADSGTVELTAPWGTEDLTNVRYDQSADVVFTDCAGVQPQKIERRGTGRSWSVVDYDPGNGPFLPARSSSARLEVSHFFGNTTLNSSIPLFVPTDVGALVRIFHNGQSGQWRLGALDAVTDAIEVTGIGDTGTHDANSERRIIFNQAGTWTGLISIERSFDGPDVGFKPIATNLGVADSGDDGTRTIDDPDDNISIWYRARMKTFDTGSNPGAAIVNITYPGGGVTGIARITSYVTNREVSIEVLSRFSDTGPSDNWQFGYWSDHFGFPTAISLHGGRLGHAQGGSLFMSVADDYENFDDTVEGDAAPIIRTLGSGPVDNIHYLISLLRLIIGTAGAELTVRSSSLDEPLTSDNSGVLPFSTQGSANLRAVRMDTRAIMVQRSGQRLYMIGPAENTLADYESFELTLLVPDLLAAGVVSVAVQRQPDTRIHCALRDGTVAILTYEPQQEVICWSTWETDGAVERVMVLPGISEDAVYYHVRRTINNVTRRYLEKWAMESECLGDTGLHWLMDCAISATDTGRRSTFTDIAPHLAGETVVAWGSLDTGSQPHVDLSPDVNGVQTTHTVDTGGDVAFSTLTEGLHHVVVGLPFTADWKSTKLAYAAQGTALTMMKKASKIGFVLDKTHNNGIKFGSDTGNLDPLPRMFQGAPVDPDLVHDSFDELAMPLPSNWNTDARIHLRAQAPRPCTVLAAIPNVTTNENK